MAKRHAIGLLPFCRWWARAKQSFAFALRGRGETQLRRRLAKGRPAAPMLEHGGIVP